MLNLDKQQYECLVGYTLLISMSGGRKGHKILAASSVFSKVQNIQ